MWEVMTGCVIMYNMVVKEECDDNIYDQGCKFQGEFVDPNPGPTGVSSCTSRRFG
jgi:hypothetical protein